MDDFITDPNGLKGTIEFYGISKTIEILNECLTKSLSDNEFNKINEINCIVDNIIRLNKELNKNKLNMKGIIRYEKD